MAIDLVGLGILNIVERAEWRDADADPVGIDAVLSREPALAESVRRTPGVRLPFTSYQMMIAQVRDAVGPVLPGRDPSWRDRRTVGSARWAPFWGDRFASLWLVADKPQQA